MICGLMAAVKIAEVNIGLVVAEDLDLPAPSQCRMLLPQVEQGAQFRKDLLLVMGPALRGEGVMLIAGKASGEIAAVIGITCAGHANLVSRVNLRNAAHGKQKRESQV